MKLYLDSADLTAVMPLLGTGIFAGVTTNPLILRQAGRGTSDLPDLVAELRGAGARQLFVQTTEDDAARIVEQGSGLAGLGPDVVVKVPATRAGLTATRRLIAEGVPVLVTAVYNVQQAVLARAVGAWGVAPYVGRMSDAGRDGLTQVATMQRVLSGSDVRVLAASIRTVDVVCRLAELGAHSATVAPRIAEELFVDDLTDRAVEEFAAAAAG